MEAKDTVMKDFDPKMTEIVRLYLAEPDEVAFDNYTERIKQAQAEISFKAGGGEEQKSWTNELKQSWKRAGIKEVVGTVGLCGYIWHDEENKAHICLDKKSWQAKLKEWGI